LSQVVIENPVINSPFGEPARHFRFTDEGITNEIEDGRRVSAYFIPIAQSKTKGKNQLQFDTEWTQDRIEENKLVNQIRAREQMNCTPDFIACIDDGHGPEHPLNLMIDVTGEKRKDKAAKVATAKTLWIPAINNHGGFGRSAFCEIDDPWDAMNALREIFAGT
jgi:hypothetical protein